MSYTYHGIMNTDYNRREDVVWTLPSMYTLMYPQITSFTESFITHITVKWTLPSAYMLMYC
jgi:hypothetical protein